jgi:parallel beta-helix repeat protein
MNRKLVCLLISVFLLVPLVGFSQANFFPPPPSLNHIYIRSDGSVDPATLPVQRVGDTYAFNRDLTNCTLEVQKSNIVVDGDGHVLDGGGFGQGLVLANLTNVVIRNMSLLNFREGVNVISCANLTFGNLRISGCEVGIDLYHSSENIIHNCNIAGNVGDGIALFDGCNQNSIVDNQIASNGNGGINLQAPNTLWNQTTCDSNNIARNKITANAVYGIWILGSSNCRIAYNNISESNRGIQFDGATSQNNVITSNVIVNCNYGLLLTGGFNHNVVSANTLANNGVGVENARTENNQFYNNNLIRNLLQVVNNFEDVASYPNMSMPIPSINKWFDSSSRKGNYWSNYVGVDNNTDGIGDVPFIIDRNNTDPYPLMKPYGGAIDYPLLSASPTPAAIPSPSPTIKPTPSAEAQSVPSVPIDAVFVLATVAAVIVIAIVFLFRKRKNNAK